MLSERVEFLPTAVKTDIPEDREEQRQLSRAQAGDEAAIDWLLARYRCRVIRLATHILRRPAEAEDVAQEAFVRAFRNLHSFRGEGRFYTWLYQIVVRICLDRRQTWRWKVETALEPVLEALPATDTALGDVETRILVEKLLDELSPPHRAILVLRELEDMEYEEIASVLQIPVGRVRWRLHTARAQFRKLWQRAQQEVEHV